jgi:diguanylate cyclase (GGDEF)-like protein
MSTPDGSCPDTVGISPQHLQIAAVCSVLVVAFALVACMITSGRAQTYVFGSSQTLALAFASAVATWFGTRSHGAGRRWRLFVAIGTFTTAAASGIAFYRTVVGKDVPTTASISGVMSIVATVFLVAALVSFPTEKSDIIPGQLHRAVRPSHLVLVLDGLLISGSIFLLLWSTTLSAVISAPIPGQEDIASPMVETVCGLVMLSVALMISAFRRPLNHRALALFLVSLIVYQVSDGALVYGALTGEVSYTTLVTFTTMTGSLLLALATCVRPGPTEGLSRFNRRERTRMWSQVLLPYAPLTAVTVLTAARVITRSKIDFVEIGAGVALVFIVIARQLVTIVQNVKLLSVVNERGHLLHYQAHHDALTGLANRKLFLERLAAAGRDRNGEGLALLFCDLDDFKKVNDVHGHGAGDAVLRTASARLLGCIRDRDLAARLGGDEFAVLLGGAGREHADRVAGRIVTAMCCPFHLDSGVFRVGVSVGAAVIDPGEAIDAETLVHRADAAMYRAKRGGKSCVAVEGAAIAHASRPGILR